LDAVSLFSWSRAEITPLQEPKKLALIYPFSSTLQATMHKQAPMGMDDMYNNDI